MPGALPPRGGPGGGGAAPADGGAAYGLGAPSAMGKGEVMGAALGVLRAELLGRLMPIDGASFHPGMSRRCDAGTTGSEGVCDRALALWPAFGGGGGTVLLPYAGWNWEVAPYCDCEGAP